MFWFRWFPWKFAVRALAKRHGFLDPLAVLAHVRRFSQPSEVMEPLELVRGSLVRHARGFINSRAIQHNLDWVWPYWVERQFNPLDASFIPRAFSLTHINLTHRNWTALGLPGMEAMPLVDPRGLLTPHFDGWSLDCAIIPEDSGEIGADAARVLPSRAAVAEQVFHLDAPPGIETLVRAPAGLLQSRCSVEVEDGRAVALYRVTADAKRPAWLAVALRPYNPEGVSVIHEVDWDADRRLWRVNGKESVIFEQAPDRTALSHYRDGDVFLHLSGDQRTGDSVRCDVGLVTAANLFRLEADVPCEVTVRVPLEENGRPATAPGDSAGHLWSSALDGCCRLEIPDARLRFLFEAAAHSLVLHAPGDVFPGPYSYKQFWFRDAAFILHALLCLGLTRRVRECLERYPARQTPFGYFRSQEGEWDSNGEAMWILRRYLELTGETPPEKWVSSVERGARWIARKRCDRGTGKPHAGLFPAGFSAEHLGPNDYYYWDDFWGVAGLEAAAWILRRCGAGAKAAEYEVEAGDFRAAIDASLAAARARLGRPAMPASPYRRLDSGSVGSLAAGYPLQLWPAHDDRLRDTVAFLEASCRVRGGFFQDMIHSGINPYLTLHLAQVLLRAGDDRQRDLVRTVADLASPTGQWPEAIHSLTGGGCMGDGQHIWAAAEWVLMLRNCFVMEESAPERLVLGAGIWPEWLDAGTPLRFGPTPTRWGVVSVQVERGEGDVVVEWAGDWRTDAPEVEVRVPGHAPQVATGTQARVRVTERSA